jgi:5-methylcytosine-specific restriction endonuclease McrA
MINSKRPRNNRRNFDKTTIDRIFSRDQYTCVYCGGLADVIDHVIPYAHSQNNEDTNLVASCKDCNSMVSDKVFSSFDEKKAYILERRNNRKWRKRLASKVPICVECKKPYRQDLKGATLFLCKDCAEEYA